MIKLFRIVNGTKDFRTVSEKTAAKMIRKGWTEDVPEPKKRKRKAKAVTNGLD